MFYLFIYILIYSGCEEGSSRKRRLGVCAALPPTGADMTSQYFPEDPEAPAKRHMLMSISEDEEGAPPPRVGTPPL